MKYRSVFDIIGPVMIGPSSSHTAGAARIGRAARDLFGRTPEEIDIHFYGSFMSTFKGHGTDVAMVGGVLGYETFDDRIKTSLETAEKEGVKVVIHEEVSEPEHPNTARLRLKSGDEELELTGISIGGGKIEITELNGFPLHLTGEHPAVVLLHDDRYGAIASATAILAKEKINIGRMEVSRKAEGAQALMIIEVDQNLTDPVMEELQEADHISRAARISE
ncbi:MULTISPECIES: L-serine ammonia-lyase, iron-sulfur-dependent subunit beta [Salimicrobium]|uniref:L-serine deaminase n=1 Tax=Salimicrobium humidisoli TaxID=2029857 RepID=A0ABX4HRI6_9BACI|nr:MULTISPECIES: L-serine ammonia-lyase, iron-sulfur-dependent subunit beta [Salimicrobium]PBB05832.1 L-serine ammonia-lyase, iron-sulfur-dependent, subunit beta [Salimicrobium humidisoli]